jgi:hypothetical protein
LRAGEDVRELDDVRYVEVMAAMRRTREVEIAGLDDANRARYEEERAAIMSHIAVSGRALASNQRRELQKPEQQLADVHVHADADAQEDTLAETAVESEAVTEAETEAETKDAGADADETLEVVVTPAPATAAPARASSWAKGLSPSTSLDSAVAAAAEALRLDPDVSLITATNTSARESLDMQDVSASATSM